MQWLALAEKGRKWDEESATPMFEYKYLNRPMFQTKIMMKYLDFDFFQCREGEQNFQVWYDDPQSLAIKYQVKNIFLKCLNLNYISSV